MEKDILYIKMMQRPNQDCCQREENNALICLSHWNKCLRVFIPLSLSKTLDH